MVAQVPEPMTRLEYQQVKGIANPGATTLYQEVTWFLCTLLCSRAHLTGSVPCYGPQGREGGQIK